MHTLGVFLGGAVCGGAVIAFFFGKLKAEFQLVHDKLNAIYKRV